MEEAGEESPMVMGGVHSRFRTGKKEGKRVFGVSKRAKAE